jgi:glycosyltransferase involved in cell wall biosynthesis
MAHTKKTHGVLILDQGETLGGAEHYLLDMLHSLNMTERKQLEIILAGGLCPTYAAKIPDGIKHELFPFVSFKGGISKKAWAGFRLLLSANKLSKYIHRQSPRVIVTNTSRTHFCLFLAKKLWNNKTRWVVIVHDFHTQKRLWRNMHIWLRKRIYRMADEIVVVSMVTRAGVKKLLPAKVGQQKIRIIENGIDFRIPPAPQTPTRLQNILILGRIDARKGQLAGIKAIELLHNEGYSAVRLTLVGDSFSKDPETVAYHRQLKKYVKQQGLTDVVHFAGPTSTPFEAIVRADCLLVLPTEPETFGRIVIEGLCMNKVVLSFAQTGPQEILKQYGLYAHKTPERLLSPVGDVRELAQNIAYFIEHPHEIVAYAEKGHTFAKKYYSLAQSKNAFLRLLVGD